MFSNSQSLNQLWSLIKGEEKVEILQSCSVLSPNNREIITAVNEDPEGTLALFCSGQPFVPSAEKFLKEILNKSKKIRF